MSRMEGVGGRLRVGAALVGVCCALALHGCATAGAKVVLAPGDVAPPFELAGSDGSTHRLADHEGSAAVVIAWFPKAFTSG